MIDYEVEQVLLDELAYDYITKGSFELACDRSAEGGFFSPL